MGYSSSVQPHILRTRSPLKPMEQILKDKFGLSKLVVCTDGGLSTYENRKRDSVGERSFITVQSLKKLRKPLQEWALDSRGWHVAGSDVEYDIRSLDGKIYFHCAKAGHKLDAVRANDKVCFTVLSEPVKNPGGVVELLYKRYMLRAHFRGN